MKWWNKPLEESTSESIGFWQEVGLIEGNDICRARRDVTTQESQSKPYVD